MSKWEESDLKHITDPDYFPNCIECSDDYLIREHKCYFHSKKCQRGLTDWDETSKRLDERLEIYEKEYAPQVSKIKCKMCSNKAVGEMHVLYHHTQTTLEKWPVCMDHAFHEDRRGRECQFRGL